MTITDIVNSILNGIPYIIGIVRNLVDGLLTATHLSGASLLIFGAISVFLAYIFLKQFILSGWTKLSTILNLVLLALVFYLLLTRVA